MLVRIVDYVANPGGGVRFTVELLKALMSRHPEVRYQLVSFGPALDRYADILTRTGLSVELTSCEPVDGWRNRQRRLAGLPGTGRLMRLLGFGTKWEYDVPESVFQECDLVWLPWIHRHRVPRQFAAKAVCSYHDAIIFEFPGLVPTKSLEVERKLVNSLLESEAQVAVSSNATVATVSRLFSVPAERLAVIPASGNHVKVAANRDVGAVPEWADQPFLFCPANTCIHKNHEVLLRGAAQWGGTYPLVLTGDGTDLKGNGWRSLELRELATELGLEAGSSLIPLGYLSNDLYYALLDRAWALVMPTLAEGGGSFPVVEALMRGTPVICSDIPVIREQIARLCADVVWFDPHDPSDLAAKLREVQLNYSQVRDRAAKQVDSLKHRSWEDVADDYWGLFHAANRGIEVAHQ